MATVVKRMPPPPPIAQNDPVFNRWLHDLTSFLSENVSLPVGSIPGYDVLLSTVATHSIQIASHTIDIATLTNQVGVNTSNISSLFTITSTHTSQIATNTSGIAANNVNITTLFARSQVLNGTAAPGAIGVEGDWFADTVTKHIYVKTGGSWVLIV